MRTAKDDPQTITEWVVRTPAIVPTIHIDVADVLAAADTPETAAEYVQRIIGMAADPTSEHLKAEVESLRRWKAEATKVIENWRAVEDRLRELPYNDEASRYADGWNHCRQAVIRLLDGES